MQIKTFLSTIAMIVLSCSLYAQDKIFMRDGETIDAKIKTVGTKTVTYSRYDNQSGPEYTIMKIEVLKIKYQNGSEDVFEDILPHGPHRYMRQHKTATSSEPATDPKVKYGPNLVALAPVQFTENGLGFSLSYERVLDKTGIIAFSMPVAATFNLNNGTYYNNATGTYTNGNQDAMYYAMPGIKLYPTGCYGRVRYGIGPSVVVATGQKSSVVYDTYGNMNYQAQTHTILGMMINNSLNINPSAHIYLGFELGLGFTYLNKVGGLNQNTNGIVEGSFKVGYRF